MTKEELRIPLPTSTTLAATESVVAPPPHPAGAPLPGVKFPTRVELEADGSVDIFVDDDEEALLVAGESGVSLSQVDNLPTRYTYVYLIYSQHVLLMLNGTAQGKQLNFTNNKVDCVLCSTIFPSFCIILSNIQQNALNISWLTKYSTYKVFYFG